MSITAKLFKFFIPVLLFMLLGSCSVLNVGSIPCRNPLKIYGPYGSPAPGYGVVFNGDRNNARANAAYLAEKYNFELSSVYPGSNDGHRIYIDWGDYIEETQAWFENGSKLYIDSISDQSLNELRCDPLVFDIVANYYITIEPSERR